MALVECLIKREGPTRVTLDKFHYVFEPQPKLTGGDEVTPVAQVLSAAHQSHFLRNTRDYRIYKPENHPQPEEAQGERKEAKPAAAPAQQAKAKE